MNMEKIYHEVLTQKDVKVKESFMECIAVIFSAIMEEEVTPHQASCILNVILSITFLVFPVSMPAVLRIIALVWMAVSFYMCRQAGIIDNE